MILSAAQRINCETKPTADKARIFNIQRYSLNDGGGIRTVVFFKGCPHTCPWCANPESISTKIQIVKYKTRCLHCTYCTNDVNLCPSGALQYIGYDISLDQLEQEVLKDEVFFRTSGGGVTLSGGEVLMQAEFATCFLHRLRRWGIHTAIETAGDGAASRLLSLAKQCDEVLFDIKITDRQLAWEIVKMNLPRVIRNLFLLVNEGVRVIPRLPIIPGYTMSEENLRSALELLAPLKLNELHLLPFHHYGEAKYHLLGWQWSMKEVPVPDLQIINYFQHIAESAGYKVTVGG